MALEKLSSQEAAIVNPRPQNDKSIQRCPDHASKSQNSKHALTVCTGLFTSVVQIRIDRSLTNVDACARMSYKIQTRARASTSS